MRVKVEKREKFQVMSTGALQYLFRGHRDEAEQPEMEKKQPMEEEKQVNVAPRSQEKVFLGGKRHQQLCHMLLMIK